MTDKKDLSQNALPSNTCPGRIELPTQKERQSLDAMRSIKARVREIKGLLQFLKSSSNEEDKRKAYDLEKELAVLKSDWDKWKKRWRDAVRERMILLGHEKG